MLATSLQTTLLLQHQPKYIAYSAIYLAAKFIDIQLPNEDGRPWYENDAIPTHAIQGELAIAYCDACAEVTE
jgi:hypothetical protein